jgi:hypothetical protein
MHGGLNGSKVVPHSQRHAAAYVGVNFQETSSWTVFHERWY